MTHELDIPPFLKRKKGEYTSAQEHAEAHRNASAEWLASLPKKEETVGRKKTANGEDTEVLSPLSNIPSTPRSAYVKNEDELQAYLTEYNDLVRANPLLRFRTRFSFGSKKDAEEALAKIKGAIAGRKDGIKPEGGVPSTSAEEKEEPMASAKKKAVKKVTAKKTGAAPRSRASTNGRKEPEKKLLGQLKPGTKRATIVEMSNGKNTVEQIAKKVDIVASQVSTQLHCLNRDTGIGYDMNEGKPKVILPTGATLKQLFKSAE